MSFCYDDNPKPYKGPPMCFENMNAVDGYLRHYSNHLYLKFIISSKGSTFHERMQAEKELKTAERKMAWWSKHPNYKKEEVQAGIRLLQKDWENN